MGALTIIYLSGCILSLGYGVLITGRMNIRDFTVLLTLSTLSWLSLFALFLGHGFNIFNKNEREDLFSINIHDIPLKPKGEKKIISGIQTHLDTTHYDLVDEKRVIVGKVFTALNLYIIDDYRLLKHCHSDEQEGFSGLSSVETDSGTEPTYPLKNMLFQIEYIFRATHHDSPKNKCQVLLKKFNSQIEKAKLLLHIQGEKSGIAFFDLIHSFIEIEDLVPDNYKIRLIDLKTGHCIFEKEETITGNEAFKVHNPSFGKNSGTTSEMAKARIIVSNQKQHTAHLNDYSDASFLHLILGENYPILSAAE